jgi:arsenate reductase
MAKPITIYGIKNCDTMKKARAWLDKNGVDYSFHDYKTAGIERERLEQWCSKVGWETLLNRAGTTFRKLPDKDKAGLDAGKAVALMLAQPSMIKRPVLDLGGGKLLVGFNPQSSGTATQGQADESSSSIAQHLIAQYLADRTEPLVCRSWSRRGVPRLRRRGQAPAHRTPSTCGRA